MIGFFVVVVEGDENVLKPTVVMAAQICKYIKNH